METVERFDIDGAVICKEPLPSSTLIITMWTEIQAAVLIVIFPKQAYTVGKRRKDLYREA